MRRRHVRVFAVIAAVLVAWNGRLAAEQEPQKIQLLLQELQKLTTQKDSSAAARSSIVNGYASEFYAGNRIELQKAADAFALKAGAGDGEALKKLSSVAESIKKAAEALRRQMPITEKTPARLDS